MSLIIFAIFSTLHRYISQFHFFTFVYNILRIVRIEPFDLQVYPNTSPSTINPTRHILAELEYFFFTWMHDPLIYEDMDGGLVEDGIEENVHTYENRFDIRRSYLKFRSLAELWHSCILYNNILESRFFVIWRNGSLNLFTRNWFDIRKSYLEFRSLAELWHSCILYNNKN